jgi:hypothetical protein
VCDQLIVALQKYFLTIIAPQYEYVKTMRGKRKEIERWKSVLWQTAVTNPAGQKSISSGHSKIQDLTFEARSCGLFTVERDHSLLLGARSSRFPSGGFPFKVPDSKFKVPSQNPTT